MEIANFAGAMENNNLESCDVSPNLKQTHCKMRHSVFAEQQITVCALNKFKFLEKVKTYRKMRKVWFTLFSYFPFGFCGYTIFLNWLHTCRRM